MRGTGRVSLASVEARWEPVLAEAGTDALGLGEQMFALVDAWDASGALRRALSDPAVGADVKAGVVHRLLEDADPRIVAAAEQIVSCWWSSQYDLAEAATQLGMDALLASAESRGDLDRVEQELFEVTRAFAGQRELRRTLHDTTIPASVRADLVEGIVGTDIAPATRVLVRRAAGAPRGRRFIAALGDVIELFATRRNRRVATVTSAAPLDESQRARLVEVLTGALGRKVQLNVLVDPRVLGGLRVQAGPDVIDATVLARLAEARRRLAG